MEPPKYEVLKHTADEEYCFQVLDLETHETYGYGLTILDAVELAARLDGQRMGSWRGGC
jgi:hypothetical protein